jgi:hypothetical protein
MRKTEGKSFQVACWCVAVTMALIGLVPAAHANGPQLGGTFKGSGPISYSNPCNGLTVSGTVNVIGVVTVFGEETGNPLVFVSAIYNAPNLTDTDGNKYNAFGSAYATYNTLASGGYYDLPMNIAYYSSNPALSFLAGTDAFVLVNSNQSPTNVPDVGRVGTCGK